MIHRNYKLGKQTAILVPVTLIAFAIAPMQIRAQIGNTATGSNALVSNTTGDYNTADGVSALFSNNIGSFNSAVGALALSSNTSGYRNTANGYQALRSNTTGI